LPKDNVKLYFVDSVMVQPVKHGCGCQRGEINYLMYVNK